MADGSTKPPSLGVLGAMKKRASQARHRLTTKREAQGKTAGERFGADGPSRPPPRGTLAGIKSAGGYTLTSVKGLFGGGSSKSRCATEREEAGSACPRCFLGPR